MNNQSTKNWNVLLIDDDEDDYILTRSMLGQAQGSRIHLEWASTFDQGQNLLEFNSYDAVLVDYDLGRNTGIELIRRTVEKGFAAPLILYTGRGSYEVDVEAMEAGATLYLTKSEANPLLLERAIRYAIENKQMKTELERQNQERSEILESIQDGFFALDSDWRFTYINQKAASNVGRKPEELIGQNLWEMFPGILGTPHETYYRKVMAERVPASFEMAGTFTNSSYDLRVFPSIEGISVYWIDITERKNSQQALEEANTTLQEQAEELEVQTEELRQQTEELFEVNRKLKLQNRLIQLSDEPIFVWDLEGGIQSWNEGCEQLYGYSQAEVIGKNTHELLATQHPVSRDKFMAQLLKEGRWIGELRHRTKDGRQVIVESRHELLEMGSQRLVLETNRDITERKQAEQALRRSEEKFAKSFRSSPVAIAISSVEEGRFIEVNDSYVSLYGYSREELIGHTSIELGMFPDPEERKNIVRLMKENGGFQNYELKLRRKSGEPLVTLFSTEQIEINGQDCMLSLVIDITARKQMEEALRESERRQRQLRESLEMDRTRLAAVLENLPVAVWISDQNGRTIGKNQAADRIWAGDAPLPESTDQYPEYIAWYPDSGRRLLPEEYPVARLLRTGQPVNPFELRIRRFDGSEGTVLASAAPIKDAEDQITGCVSINIDITERKRLEEAVKDSEKKYRELVQHAPAAIYEIDFRSRRFTSVNDAMCLLSGYSREELLRMTPFAILDEPSQRIFQDRTKRWLAGEKLDENVEYRVLAKDGHEIFAALNVTFIHDEKGEPLRATVIAHDVTGRRRVEQALHESNERLKLSNQALQDFAFIASHDLKEPLRKILAFGSLLTSKYSPGLDEQGRDYIQRMQSAAERMQNMLDGVLEYSRITSQESSTVKIDLNQLIKNILSDLEVRIQETGGRIEVGDLPELEGDPVQIRQLFQNLVGNALKFHRPGIPPLVKIYSRPSKDSCMELSVEDNGIGFDMKHIDNLFQPFNRLVGRNEYEGSGMGLAICKKIVERHGGSISARSVHGEGSTFTVILPVKQRQD